MTKSTKSAKSQSTATHAAHSGAHRNTHLVSTTPVEEAIESSPTRTASGGITAPPTTGAPKPRDGFVVTPGLLKNRPRLPRAFPAMAATLVTELRGSTTYAEDFGKNAPKSEDLATRIESTAAWQREQPAAEAWYAYTKDEMSRGWQATQDRLRELKGAFEYALDRDGTIAERYPSLVAYYELPKAAARRAAATRAENKKEKAKAEAAAAATAVATPASSTTAPPTAPPVKTGS